MRLDHTIVPCENKEVTTSFFTDVLGFARGESLPEANFVYVDDRLTLRCDQKYDHQVHLGFLVTPAELRQVIGRAEASGVAYGSRANQMDHELGEYGGGPRVYFRDPCNNSIELVTVPTIRHET